MSWIDAGASARRRLRIAIFAAYLCFAVNLAASVAAAIVLEPGATTHPLGDRARYVAEHAAAWRGSWMIWMAAAPSLAFFYAAFAATLAPELKVVRSIAVAAACAGVLADVYAETILAFRLPPLYAEVAGGDVPVRLEVLRLEDAATLLTGALANGLYTIAGAMLTLAAAATQGFPRALAWLGAPAWCCGAALSIACLARHPMAVAVTMAATMAFFLFWLACFIVVLWRRLRRP